MLLPDRSNSTICFFSVLFSRLGQISFPWSGVSHWSSSILPAEAICSPILSLHHMHNPSIRPQRSRCVFLSSVLRGNKWESALHLNVLAVKRIDLPGSRLFKAVAAQGALGGYFGRCTALLTTWGLEARETIGQGHITAGSPRKEHSPRKLPATGGTGGQDPCS